MFEDNRYNYFNLNKPFKWSTDFNQFPGIPFAIPFELLWKNYGHSIHKWMKLNWSYSIYISITYIIIVFSTKCFLRNKKPFQLRLPLFIWNSTFALFSLIGTIRCLPEFIDVISTKGLITSYCNSCYYKDMRLMTWYWLFVISKIIELGDTMFIVLRKQKLIHLHWIHHSLTLIFSWFVYSDMPSTARWMVNMNFFVHSIMYSYYAIVSIKLFKIPKSIAFSITSIQLLQMVFGFAIHLHSLMRKFEGQRCDLDLSVAFTGIFMFLLHFILFLNYFINNYYNLMFHQVKMSMTFDSKGQINNKSKGNLNDKKLN